MSPRKYHTFDDLQHDLDSESILSPDDEDNLLEEEDLKLLQGPKIPKPVKTPKKRVRKAEAKPKKKAAKPKK